MKVKSNKEVNIRAFEPYRKSNNLKGILNPGFEIEVEEVPGEDIIEGEGVNQIHSDKWYKDKNGDYYWSGGFESTLQVESKVSNNDLYLEVLNNLADKKAFRVRGKDINIAILDSGIYIDRHPSLRDKILTINGDFSHAESKIKNAHGTKVAGILVAEEKHISGVTPEAKLLDFRVIDENEIVDEDGVIRALKYINERSVPVNLVNMSFDINEDRLEEIQEQIDILYRRGILSIVATGDYLITQRLKNVVKVKVKESYQVEMTDENSITIAYKDVPFKTTAIDEDISEFKHSSAYTAFTTGILSNLLSSGFLTSKNRFEEIATFFKNNPIRFL